MTSLKDASVLLRGATLELAASRGLRADALSTSDDALVLLAAAALKSITSSSSSSAELVAAAREARRLLRPHIPRGEEETSPGTKRSRAEGETEADREESNPVDLGQYADTELFNGDARKRNKFARLMGGAKSDGSHHPHNTHAADKGTRQRINGELEEQYNTALQRHGKKGLGA